MSEVIFREGQPIRKVRWVLVVIYGISLLMWYTFIMQIINGVPVGNNPASDRMVWIYFLLFGIGLPVLFHYMQLIVEVDAERVRVRYIPFIDRSIPLSDIGSCEAKRYQPIRDFGGWGIRGLTRRRRAYNVRGDEGVELTLRDGSQIMLGSQRADVLEYSIKKALSGRAESP